MLGSPITPRWISHPGQTEYPSLWQGRLFAWGPSSRFNGKTLYDFTGKGYDCILTNMDALTDIIASDRNQIVDFDGVNDRGDIVYKSDMDMQTWSLATWVKFKATPAQDDTLISKGYNGVNRAYGLDITISSSTPRFRSSTTYNSGLTTAEAVGSTVVTAGVWYHVVALRDQTGRHQIWVNGRPEAISSTLATAFNSTKNINIGYLDVNGTLSRFSNCQMDDIGIWNRALLDFEIRTLAQRRNIEWDTKKKVFWALGLPPIQGSASLTFGAMTLAGVSDIDIAASASITLGAMTFSGAAKVDLKADANIAFGAMLAQGTTTLALQAAGVSTFGAMELAATGSNPIVADANLTLGAMTLSAQAENSIVADANITLGAMTLSGQGTVLIKGELSQTLGEMTLSAQGNSFKNGEANITFGAMTMTGSGVLPLQASANITFGAMISEGQGDLALEGEATITLGSLLLEAVAELPVSATGDITFGEMTLTATGESLQPIEAVADITFGEMILTASGSRRRKKVLVSVDGSPVTNGQLITFTPVNVGEPNQVILIEIENTGLTDIKPKPGYIGVGFEVISYDAVIEPGMTGEMSVRSVTAVPGTWLQTLNVTSGFSLQLSIVISTTEEVYTDEAEIRRVFGSQNVTIWGDRDGTLDPNKISGLVYQFARDASREIDSYLSMGVWQVPFASPYPPMIKQMATQRCGVQMYTARGMYSEALGKVSQNQQRLYLSTLEDIRRGKINLEGELRKIQRTAPFVGS